ncbi:MAG: hypothetical protein JNG89_04995 [Planctomycetaceae bacterium]|nr:hypothetical protein [Planctomycetaceae bacterium]
MTETRDRIHELINSLKQQRDELAVRMHLAGAEAKQEWSRLDDKVNQLSHRFDPLKQAVGESTDDVWISLKLLGEELQHGFQRIRKSL